jgi:N,N'-diacetyllegionaminate synthase
MKKIFKIGKVNFSSNKCVIIAEAGVNHNGSLRIAENLIKQAKLAGADIIKFQTYKADKLVVKNSPRFWSWSGEKKKIGTQYDSYSKLDIFNEKEYKKLVLLCNKYKIEFMSTPFDEAAVDMLVRIGCKGFKVASCDINNYPLLEKISKTKKPILLSTGASNLEEIKKTVSFLKKRGVKKLCIMQCTLSYPTKKKDANLNVISQLNRTFKDYLIGFSDHTLGINAPIASVALGARVIEKHYTIDKKLKKSADHWLSVNPKELKKIREGVDDILLSLGEFNKKVLNCEYKTRKFARRSLVAKVVIHKGDKISIDKIIPKRPGDGISPDKINLILNKTSKKKLNIDEKLQFKNLR